jgi:hypothetical protein
MDLSSGNEEHASHDMGLVIERTDGCALRGAPDGNGKWRDWIVACEYQEQVYPLLLDALNAIAP